MAAPTKATIPPHPTAPTRPKRGARNEKLVLPVEEVANTVSPQTKGAVCVDKANLPLDLQLVCNAWRDIPKEIRTKIVNIF